MKADPKTLTTVQDIIAKQLAVDTEKVLPEAKFADLGADSLDTVRNLDEPLIAVVLQNVCKRGCNGPSNRAPKFSQICGQNLGHPVFSRVFPQFSPEGGALSDEARSF